ncbi:MAG: phosphohistidine phosphatase [Ignavibacteriales bacterium CG_4_9_14_3_um_filter_34_10]|nr:MAG: phosphohistidine phosphatase [Ignavibacteriales bacterium CG_4_9_14_3_um_filter_34_10]
MKELYLLRHGKSSWNDPTISDVDRPLNKRGKKDAEFMGNVMRQLNLFPEIIITSTAKRAYSTAKRIAGVLEYEKEKLIKDSELYDCSTEHLLNFVKSLNDIYDKFLIVGHNPEITLFTNRFCNESIINIPTCGLVVIKTDSKFWNELNFGIGVLSFFEYPKKYY